MAAHSIVPLFEDHGEDWLDLLRLLLRRTQSPLSAAYAERVARILRHEIALDTTLSKQDQWSFTTLHELHDQIELQSKAVPLALKASVTCLSQIGLFLK
jgi:Starter unit:ACP transacylase in aflatoxin biosynthesis